MLRRDFCKLMAAAAAARTVRLGAQSDGTADSPTFHEFNTYSQDYAQFCATPAGQRHFYALENGQFVKESLDEKDWKPTEWGEAPELPVSGGSWDGVPMDSPIADLGGEGPYKPTWDSLLQYDAPEWYRDAKFGIWAHWSPQCVPEAGDWYARNMYMEGSEQYKFQLEHYGPSFEVWIQGALSAVDAAELGAGGADRALQEGRSQAVYRARQSSRRLRRVGLEASAVERGEFGPHRDVVGAWAAAARKQGLRFGVTVHQARNWWWFQTSHGADKTGPMAGVSVRRRSDSSRRARTSGGRGLIRSGCTGRSTRSMRCRIFRM